MCFSTEASFSAAVLLGAMGIVTTKTCQSKQLYFLAAVPFLFAIQQLSEGIIWYNFAYHALPKIYFLFAIKAFLTFAMLVWPIWIPLSLAAAETVPLRKKIIIVDLIAGIGLSTLNLIYALKQEMAVQIVNHSIQYLGDIPPQKLLYPFIVLLPCFISSRKNMWMFGVLLAIAYAVAEYFYESTFISVWCFFAALTSLIIYKIIRDNQKTL